MGLSRSAFFVGQNMRAMTYRLVSILVCFSVWMPIRHVSSNNDSFPTWRRTLHIHMSGGASSSTFAEVDEKNTNMENKKNRARDSDVLIVFSDVDGTLVHYPTRTQQQEQQVQSTDPNNRILHLPPSSTGMRGIISSRTLTKTQELRHAGVYFVLVSGMRTSTLLQRLPYLPKADAYASEAGGRIFYLRRVERDNPSDGDGYTFTPLSNDGAHQDRRGSFCVVEDLEWRRRMERTKGSFGTATLQELASNPSSVRGIDNREGLLWDYGRELVSKGFVLDTKGYAACFRINQKHQTSLSEIEFQTLLQDNKLSPWSGLASSVNLSSIDIYPEESGKKNCCRYLAEKFFPNLKENIDEFLSSSAVCVCDDDNDLEMAFACNHAYIPSVSSDSMARAIRDDPSHFMRTGGNEATTDSTEAAIDLILERISASSKE